MFLCIFLTATEFEDGIVNGAAWESYAGSMQVFRDDSFLSSSEINHKGN